MRAYEIPIKVTAKGTLELPADLLARLLREQVMRAIILVPEPTIQEERTAWSRLTAKQFLAGYGEADAIYDRI